MQSQSRPIITVLLACGFFLVQPAAAKETREREGFREANSDFDLDAGAIKLVYDPSQDNRFTLTFDGYEEEHGEPGGLTAIPGLGAVLYSVDRNATARFFDRFRLQRAITRRSVTKRLYRSKRSSA